MSTDCPPARNANILDLAPVTRQGANRPSRRPRRGGIVSDGSIAQQERGHVQQRRGRGSVHQGSSDRVLDSQNVSNISPNEGANTGTGRPFRRRPRRGREGAGRSRQNQEVRSDTRGTTTSSATTNQRAHGRHVTSRQFTGQLTTEVDEGTQTQPVQPAQAVKGNAEEQKSHGGRGARMPPKPKQPKSEAADIATRISEDIDNGQYECPICTNEVRRNSRIWSCESCWTVFHLSCVRKWASNQTSKQVQEQQENRESHRSVSWRCPGCNLPKESLPHTYTCWCHKEQDPRNTTGLPPHSCGNTCAKERTIPKKCPHPCQLMCHPGPCTPCTYMGPTQSCFCGKNSVTRRCLDTNYDTGWSCGQQCENVMPCGNHTCARPCHEGSCGSCEEVVHARCYCGKSKQDIMCCETGQQTRSVKSTIVSNEEVTSEAWVGSFDCKNSCNREFNCGIHRCRKTCHPQEAKSTICPRSPQLVSHCPCGKTRLKEISDEPRNTCEDHIPNCNKPCLKELQCGHQCQGVCHQGACMPCLQKISISCRCKRTISSSICHQGLEIVPQCSKICRATLNCGRHSCDEHCCTGERKAQERQSIKRKPRALDSAPLIPTEMFEAEHICTRVCGRPLKCGTHFCQELCHKGPCNSCREAIFDEISCHCGRTILHPPLPCGTKPPSCRYDCERPKSCGHPQVKHNCHSGDEDCPRCPYLITKRCLCGKKVLKNQQCWLTDVRCGEICGRKLRCGSHFCKKSCHSPGECEDSASVSGCQQPCGKPRKICGHPDDDTCHAPYPCRENKPCAHKLIITCACQHLKQEMKCNASTSSTGNSAKSLQCDQECARLERNRKLASAFDIDIDTHSDDHIPYSSETLAIYQEQTQWAQNREREFRIFSADENEKRLRFKPMQKRQRAFLHALAEDFGLDSESMDPEPHRHVTIFKTPKFVMAPMKSLAQCIGIRHTQRLAAATETQLNRKSKVENTGIDVYNGFLITKPRFALTIEELQSVVNPIASMYPELQFQMSFLPSEDIAIKFSFVDKNIADENKLDSKMAKMKPLLSDGIASSGIGNLQLCQMDDSLNVLRRENNSTTQNGWSQVAARAAAPAIRLKSTTVGSSGSFAVLGGKISLSTRKTPSKIKKAQDVVVDDWEEAEGLEEKKEQIQQGQDLEATESLREEIRSQ